MMKKTYIEKKYTIVLTEADRVAAEAHIDSCDFLAFDTETTGLNTRKDQVIGFSFSGEQGVAFYYPLMTWNGTELEIVSGNYDKLHCFLEKLKDRDLLMWNGSFDIRMIKNNFDIDLTDSLLADGMLMKHTLEEEGPFGLKKAGIEIQKHIGLDVETEANIEQIKLKENVQKNGGSTTKTNYEMYKADLDVMGPYGAADADLTLRICDYYNNRLEEENLAEFFYDEEVMPLYKTVTIPMEDHGVKLDIRLLKKTRVDIEKDIIEMEETILSELFKLDEVDTWFSNKVESFCDEVPRGNYAQGVAYYYDLPLPCSPKTGKYSVSKKNVEDLPDSEGKRFLLGEIGSLGLRVQRTIKTKIYLGSKESGGKKLNISSKKQMGEIVFDEMGIRPLSHTEKGAPQFNDTMITHLADVLEFSWAKMLSDYNKLIKIKGAYVDRFLDNHEDGYYFFSYKQHGTISGRYSSDAQQLPRPKEEGELSTIVLKYNNLIRTFFIVNSDRVFIDSDYESLEPHVFAHVSGDEGLRDIFRKGHDFYSTIAIATEGLYEYSADKKADNYLGKLNKPKRQSAKIYSLGIPYGMGDYALGKNLDIPTIEATDLLDSYLGAYPKLKEWMDRSKDMAHTKGYVVSEAGRVRHLPQVKNIFKIHKDKLMHFQYRKHLEKRLEKWEVLSIYRDYKNGVNNSRNVQIQSLSASIVNKAAIAINERLKKEGIDGWCCAQIHDQLIFNVPKKYATACRNIVQDLMENTTKLSLELRAPAEIGKNWAEAH